MNKKTFIILVVILILTITGVMWFFLFRAPATPATPGDTTDSGAGGFAPYNRGTNGGQNKGGGSDKTLATSTPVDLGTTSRLPILRKIYDKPVGGMGATSTASTTSVVHFIDRGTGYVYEANNSSLDLLKLSNTTIPRVYETFWQGNMKSFIIRTIKEGEEQVGTLYADLNRVVPQVSTTTASSSDSDLLTSTAYEVKGRYMTSNILEIAASPKNDKIFELVNEKDRGVGYVSSFDEKTHKKVFDSPMTQLNIDWPEENTIIMSTKGTAYGPGYVYALDLKKGSFNKILNGIRGLSAKMNHDASMLLYTQSKTDGTLGTYVKKMKDGSIQELVVKTIADKCAWGTVQKQYLYCAVPNRFPDGSYPDDWYTGRASFTDQIWRVNSVTGEVLLLANPVDLASTLIDITNPVLDPKENTLYFINKKDLSLWSLDLTQN